MDIFPSTNFPMDILIFVLPKGLLGSLPRRTDAALLYARLKFNNKLIPDVTQRVRLKKQGVKHFPNSGTHIYFSKSSGGAKIRPSKEEEMSGPREAQGACQGAGSLKIWFQESKSFPGTPAAVARGDHLPVKRFAKKKREKKAAKTHAR